MSNEKRLNARLIQKHDTAENWKKASYPESGSNSTPFVPLKGEIIIYTDLNKMKIGDGETIVDELPFIEGKIDTYSEYSNALGYNVQAGGRGFKVIACSGTKGGTGSYTLSSTTGLEVGMNYNVRLSDVMYNDGTINTGKITAINGNVITVSNYPAIPLDGGADSEFAKEDYLTITGRPDLGDMEVGFFALAVGEKSIAQDRDAVAIGRETKAIGQYAFAEGRQTVAGYASHAEGNRTKALANGSHAEGQETYATDSQAHAEGKYTKATGQAAHAEGYGWTDSGSVGYNIASGKGSHAEGIETKALGKGSHAEGQQTTAQGDYSHSEGLTTKAVGVRCHAEGTGCEAYGYSTHAEGSGSIAKEDHSHAEGSGTQALGNYSHSEGRFTIASGVASHSEGQSTQSVGDYSHSEGRSTKAQGKCSHAEGYDTIVDTSTTNQEIKNNVAAGQMEAGQYCHAEGYGTKARGTATHAEGTSTVADGFSCHAEGSGCQAYMDHSHAEGSGTKAEGNYSHSEGRFTVASGRASHAEGEGTIANGSYQHVQGKYNITDENMVHIVGWGEDDSNRKNIHTIDTNGTGWFAGAIHAEDSIYAGGKKVLVEGDITQAEVDFSAKAGSNTESVILNDPNNIASGEHSLAQGLGNTASGANSHAEGRGNTASGEHAHAEGHQCVASAEGSHAEGSACEATGVHSHAEGNQTQAMAYDSHAEGLGTVATGRVQHVQGKFNEEDTENKYAHIVGGGTSFLDRKNIHTLDWNGNAWFEGNITGKNTSQSYTKITTASNGNECSWSYRKWEDGRVECWGNFIAFLSSTSNMTIQNDLPSVSLPVTMKDTTSTQIVATCSSMDNSHIHYGWLMYPAYTTSNTGAGCRFGNFDGELGIIHLTVTGYWK